MNKKDYISLANKAARIQINELKKIKKVFNKSFIDAVDSILNQKRCTETWDKLKKKIF